MVLSVAMSRGRTTPATLSTRSSKFTRTSWVPLMTRLPFGRTSETTAATSSSMLSERVIAPAPLVDVPELTEESSLPSPLPVRNG